MRACAALGAAGLSLEHLAAERRRPQGYALGVLQLQTVIQEALGASAPVQAGDRLSEDGQGVPQLFPDQARPSRQQTGSGHDLRISPLPLTLPVSIS